MDPLSVTASVLALVTAAAQSCKITSSFIDGLAEAPQAIAASKALLSETLNSLKALEQTLGNDRRASPSVLDSTLRAIKLDNTLQSTQEVCDGFSATIAKVTKHSTEERFSTRDRLAAQLRESKINRFNQQLGDCQRTVSLVLGSITLIISSHTSEDIDRLGNRFSAQETALVNLGAQLRNREIPEVTENERSIQLTDRLQQLCQDALSATQAKRTGQSFGDLRVSDNSGAMQGIAGQVDGKAEQSFGNLTATQSSRAFQGQIDAASFAVMFGK
ncbi:hypothetical protein NUU61_006094 [Penicillium alfredii]|uniref:Azaphilone pigments biosynthesis cluster protein L N-terminal domain-containing protein n=1 Tax=Penicillium alfredii TaxID=1506179 RepID=A0A9W9F0E0_9EURO|nr:uncharacterized protein NUU61_006094 [Penicillium alfredii]KAJ5091224.1 hypothetical protein NUU61_006094 [Penicillium alfredii]